jgi:nucleoside-diphosphate-sugar epimerase
VSSGEGQARQIHDCNVVSTRHLLHSALDTGVERVVVTGSLSAIGWVLGGPSDESVAPYQKKRGA